MLIHSVQSSMPGRTTHNSQPGKSKKPSLATQSNNSKQSSLPINTSHTIQPSQSNQPKHSGQPGRSSKSRPNGGNRQNGEISTNRD